MSTMTFYRQATMGRPVAGSRGGDDDDDDPVDIPLRLRPINQNMDRLLFGNPRTTASAAPPRPAPQRYFPPESSQWGWGGGGPSSQWSGVGGRSSQWGSGNGGSGLGAVGSSSSGVAGQASYWGGAGSRGSPSTFGRYNFGGPPPPPSSSSFSNNFSSLSFSRFGGTGADDDAFGFGTENENNDDDDDDGDTDIPLRLKQKPTSFDRLLSGGRGVPAPAATWVPPPPIRSANVPVEAPEPIHPHHPPKFDESAIVDDDDDDSDNDDAQEGAAGGGAGAAPGAKPYKARGQTPNRRITQSELESLPDQELLLQALRALGYSHRWRDDDDDGDEAEEGSSNVKPSEPEPELKLRRGRANFGMEWGKV